MSQGAFLFILDVVGKKVSCPKVRWYILQSPPVYAQTGFQEEKESSQSKCITHHNWYFTTKTPTHDVDLCPECNPCSRSTRHCMCGGFKNRLDHSASIFTSPMNASRLNGRRHSAKRAGKRWQWYVKIVVLVGAHERGIFNNKKHFRVHILSMVFPVRDRKYTLRYSSNRCKLSIVSFQGSAHGTDCCALSLLKDIHNCVRSVAQDAVYEFEKRRHVPVKYDRELWQNTGKQHVACSRRLCQ